MAVQVNGSPPPLPAVTRWLVLIVAAIGFLFDTYELLMFPVIGAQALSELLGLAPTADQVRLWSGRMLWIAALSGGLFGLMGGYLIDRLGRKTVMVGSILLYSFSPVAAAYSTQLWQFVLFRCTTFIGVCVEMVAAVTWLAELFTDKRQREAAIGWTLACASIGGILVTEVYNGITGILQQQPGGLSWLPVPAAAWRYTLLTGLIPGALILLLMPFVPESQLWWQRKQAGALRRPRFRELFAPELRAATLTTTVLSACAYAAAFGALQLTPLQIVPGLPVIEEARRQAAEGVRQLEAQLQQAATESERRQLSQELQQARDQVRRTIDATRGNIQRWQELGGLTGRVLFAACVVYVASRVLIRLFLIPGLILFPVTYYYLRGLPYEVFATAIFFCGLVTVAQFSYVSEYLPKVFPLHLRGTGSAFATNIGGRMLGTMAAFVNTELLAPLFSGDNPQRVAMAAAVLGAGVYLIALVTSFFLPPPRHEED